MSLADAVLSALSGFKDEVSSWTNSGLLVSIESHIAQVEHAVATDVHAGETAAKAVLAELYGAFHGSTPVEPVAPVAMPATEVTATSIPSTVPVQMPVAPEVVPAPAAEAPAPADVSTAQA